MTETRKGWMWDSSPYCHVFFQRIAYRERSQRSHQPLHGCIEPDHQQRSKQHIADKDPVSTLCQLAVEIGQERKGKAWIRLHGMILNQHVIGKTGIFGYTHTDHQEENQAVGVWRWYHHLHQRACACCIYTDSKHLRMVPRFVQAEWNGVWIRNMGAWTDRGVRRHLQTSSIWAEPIELSGDCRLLQVDIGAMFSGKCVSLDWKRLVRLNCPLFSASKSRPGSQVSIGRLVLGKRKGNCHILRKKKHGKGWKDRGQWQL